ncbi:MAG: carbohydrate kinase [Lentisphaeria bacterium]|nr:carbohydrate kinase [Lentisphaeria bacterium]
MSTDRLLSLMQRFPDCRLGVVGDLMLDRYIWGRATRISQEAPVPVVQVQRESATPGGAANVVRNLTAMGCRTSVFGIVGEDRYADNLLEALRQCGASLGGVLTVPGRGTTVKTRLIAGNQQVARIDREDASPLDGAFRNQLLGALRTRVERGEVQALVLEDYAKGLLSRDSVAEIVELCRGHGVSVALDPHPANAFNIPGLRLLTPNRAEAFALAGRYYQAGVMPLDRDLALLDVGQRLLALWQPELLLITLGADGMALFQHHSRPLHIPTKARQVFDVSGAGDTVIAIFALALAAAATPEEAAHLANHAAGIVVGKVGTATVTPEELVDDIRGDRDGEPGADDGTAPKEQTEA